MERLFFVKNRNREEVVKLNISNIVAPDERISLRGVTCDEIMDSPHPSIRQKGVISDPTGSCEFVLWEKSAMKGTPELTIGSTYNLDNVFTKEFRGEFSVAMTAGTTVTKTGQAYPVQRTLGD